MDRRLAVQTFELQQRRNEAYLAEAQRLSHTGSFGWKVSSRDIYWSEETFKIFGYEQAVKPTLQLVFQRMHPDDRDLVQQKIEHAARERKDFDLEHRLLMPEGSIKHLHVLARALSTSPGDLEFVGAVTDVTAAKQAEMKVRESEAYLAEAQRLSHTGSWAWSPPSGDIRYWSEECYRIQGFDPKEEQPKYEVFFQTIHPDDRARVAEVIERAVREKEEFEFDYRIVHSDGEIRDARSFGHPVFGPSGDLVEYVGTIIDVTERKQAEDKIRQSEAYLAEAQRLSHTGSWAWNPTSGENRYWSDESFRLMGFDPGGGMPPFETVLQRFHPDDQPKFAEQLERARREQAEFEVDYRIIHPSGEIRDIHAVGHPVLGPSGDLVEFVGSVIDVTERKQAEKERERLREAQAELAHASRMSAMGELTASLAHEVNQPITAAVNGASTCVRWLTRNEPDLGEAREAALGVVRNAKRASDIINRIRLLSKKDESTRQLADVNELIREIIALLSNEVQKYAISILADLNANLPKVMADSVQVQQVIMNLIMNSIDAMKDVDQRRELVVRSQRTENEGLMISISDTGVGLPPQEKDKIFDAFFTTKPHGIGMGLRISRSIVESHGGRLWASENSPRGARLCFTLPIPMEAPEERASPSDAHTNV
jgi:PAS domain S-box-containing protein